MPTKSKKTAAAAAHHSDSELEGKEIESETPMAPVPSEQSPAASAPGPTVSAPVVPGPMVSAPMVSAPLAKNQILNESVNLIDIPCVFLHDRTCWSDFKKALHECGLIWGLPDWMTTITYKGIEWQTIQTTGVNLNQYFPPIDKTAAGDGLISKSSTLGMKLVGLLGRPKSLTETISSVQFCCLTTVEFEHERRLPSRQKLWSWMVRSLRGNKPAPGPYHYLVDEVQTYDISYLFKRLIDVLEQVTICSLDDELEAIIKMDFKPASQNIFSYLGELKKAIKRLNDINDRLPQEGRIVLPDSYIRSRLVRAARQVPVYKPVLDRLLITPMNEWTVMTSEDLFHQLEAVCANDQSTGPKYSVSTSSFDSLAANTLQFKEKKKEQNKKPQTCFDFSRGSCSRNPCKFSHAYAPEKSGHSQKKNGVPQPANASNSRCGKCDSTQHLSADCGFNGVCQFCSKQGHNLQACRAKKNGKTKANLAQADGNDIWANVFTVEEDAAAAYKNISMLAVDLTPPPDGMVRETFLADTGATRSLHPNGRSASSFSRVSLEISTACVGSTMRSEGVGQMKVYTPDGSLFPGFDDVVFSRQCAKKLASIGRVCDADMVCVFDKHGLSTYHNKDVKITGKIFTKDERDKKTGLYPLSLFRKVAEKPYANISISPIASDFEKKKQRQDEKVQTEKLPLLVSPSSPNPTSSKDYQVWKDIMRSVGMWE